VVALGVLWLSTTGVDGRESIDLTGFIQPDHGASAFLPGGHDATATICGDGSCVQAVDSDTALLRKFATQAEAEEAAAALGDRGRLSGWIVVELKPDGLSPTDQAQLMQGIDGTNVDSPD